jgi:thiol-disulfide isomerase/thioredoxin
MRKLNPPAVTFLLSVAAVAVYLGYRMFAPGVPSDEGTMPVESPDAAAQQLADLPDELPDFVIDNVAGTPTPIDTWAGNPLIVNFWATWCAPCLREIPMLKAYQADNPDVTVVGIAIDRVDPVVAFAEEMEFNYPILVGPNSMDAAGAFGVEFIALPFTVFTSSQGAVIGVHTGELHAEHLENFSGVLADLDNGTIDVAAARLRLAGRM